MNHIYTALDCKYVSDEESEEVKMKSDILLKLINGYIYFLKTKKQNETTNKPDK